MQSISPIRNEVIFGFAFSEVKKIHFCYRLFFNYHQIGETSGLNGFDEL